jgi:hypothetical protein
VFDFLIDIVTLLLQLFLDLVFIGHSFQFQLLVNHESVGRIRQLRVQPRYQLLSLSCQLVELPSRVRLLQSAVHRLLGSIEVLVEHLILDSVVPKLQCLPLLLRRLLFIHNRLTFLPLPLLTFLISECDNCIIGILRLCLIIVHLIGLFFFTRARLIYFLQELRGKHLKVFNFIDSLVEILAYM